VATRSRADVAIDENLLQQSRTARTSRLLIQASMIMHVLTPVLVIMGIVTLTALPALAQSPGGSIFGGNDQPSATESAKLSSGDAICCFCSASAVSCGAAFNYMTEKNWTKQGVGSVFCFCFSAPSRVCLFVLARKRRQSRHQPRKLKPNSFARIHRSARNTAKAPYPFARHFSPRFATSAARD